MLPEKLFLKKNYTDDGKFDLHILEYLPNFT